MKFSTLFPSKHFQASDFEDGPRILQVAGIEVQRMKDGEDKPLLRFHNAEKTMLLNMTNGNTLRELYGEPDDWIGQSIECFATTTDFQGKRVPCIRMRAPQKAGSKKAAPPPDPLKFNDLEDDIPF